MKKSLSEALLFAKDVVNLKPDGSMVVKCGSKIPSGYFGAPQGLYDGVEILELIGIYMLSKINKTVHIDNHRIYHNDSLMAVPNNNRKKNNSIRKKLHQVFKEMDFDITVKINKKVVQFLDTELNLLDGNISPHS